MTSDESRTVISRSSGRCHPPYVGFHRHRLSFPSPIHLLGVRSLRPEGRRSRGTVTRGDGGRVETEGRGFLPATAPSLPTVLRRPRWSASVPLATLIPSAYRLRPPAARM